MPAPLIFVRPSSKLSDMASSSARVFSKMTKSGSRLISPTQFGSLLSKDMRQTCYSASSLPFGSYMDSCSVGEQHLHPTSSSSSSSSSPRFLSSFGLSRHPSLLSNPIPQFPSQKTVTNSAFKREMGHFQTRCFSECLHLSSQLASTPARCQPIGNRLGFVVKRAPNEDLLVQSVSPMPTNWMHKYHFHRHAVGSLGTINSVCFEAVKGGETTDKIKSDEQSKDAKTEESLDLNVSKGGHGHEPTVPEDNSLTSQEMRRTVQTVETSFSRLFTLSSVCVTIQAVDFVWVLSSSKDVASAQILENFLPLIPSIGIMLGSYLALSPLKFFKTMEERRRLQTITLGIQVHKIIRTFILRTLLAIFLYASFKLYFVSFHAWNGMKYT